METDYLIDDDEPDLISMSKEDFIKAQNEYIEKSLKQNEKLQEMIKNSSKE